MDNLTIKLEAKRLVEDYLVNLDNPQEIPKKSVRVELHPSLNDIIQRDDLMYMGVLEE